jgi:hypothetical protein
LAANDDTRFGLREPFQIEGGLRLDPPLVAEESYGPATDVLVLVGK